MATPNESPLEKCIDSYTYLFRKDLLRGKTVFVTGGGTGIGFTITEVLMRHGCNAVIGSRRLDKCQESARTLEAGTGQTCLAVRLDVRDPKSIQEAMAVTLKRFGRIDILVNSAAGNFLSPAEGLSPNAFRTVMDIDANGTFNVSKAVFTEYMKDHGGVIVNITATLHFRGQAFQTHVGCAKAAIESMTRHLAVEWGERAIRVMCVAPGPIEDTEGFRRLGGGTSVISNLRQQIPIGRVGRREDIANTVLYVVSDAAQLLTGTTIIADGGSWLTSSNGLGQMRLVAEQQARL